MNVTIAIQEIHNYIKLRRLFYNNRKCEKKEIVFA